MPPYQRRHGVPARIWKVERQADNRGNVQEMAVDTEANPAYEVNVWTFPQRASKAEVPGELDINVIRIGCDPDLEGVDLWSRVEVLGSVWDVTSPPMLHQGTRHTRHWTIELRERP